MKNLHRVVFVLVAFLMIAGVAIGQEQTASIQGIVSDSSGAPLPGVLVTAANKRGQSFNVTTDSNGWYRFASVPPGTYGLTVELSGLESIKVDQVRLSLGSAPKVDIAMRVSAVAQAITIKFELSTSTIQCLQKIILSKW